MYWSGKWTHYWEGNFLTQTLKYNTTVYFYIALMKIFNCQKSQKSWARNPEGQLANFNFWPLHKTINFYVVKPCNYM